MKRKTLSPPKPVRSPQVPVTVEMLNEMEDRLGYKVDAGLSALRSEMHGIKSDLKSEIHGLRTELKSEIHALRDDMAGMKTEIHEIKTEISGFKSELHRVALLVEEQNARNKFVLDGYAQLYELIERKLA